MTSLGHCQRNNGLIFRSANTPDHEKSQRLLQQEEHLRVVQLERSLYNKMVDEAKATSSAHQLAELKPSTPCNREFSMHYSYTQQVHLPSNPLQPGPLYFLVPRKCELFGVCCEGLPRQVNFLVDEAHLISKGSNAVISYLHYFFENFGLGETDVHLHCDNCSGQNKNRFVLWYCAWRVAMLNILLFGWLCGGFTPCRCYFCQFLCKISELSNFVYKYLHFVTASHLADV